MRFFAHVQTGPGVHPASCTMGTGSFPGVNRPGRGADHPPPSSAEVTKGSSYSSIHLLGQFRPVTRLLYLTYMFRALLAHPQKALHKRHLVYCVRVMSFGCHQDWSGTGVGDSSSTPILVTKHARNIPSVFCAAPPEEKQIMLETCTGP
jgi:hypothetical protein